MAIVDVYCKKKGKAFLIRAKNYKICCFLRLRDSLLDTGTQEENINYDGREFKGKMNSTRSDKGQGAAQKCIFNTKQGGQETAQERQE